MLEEHQSTESSSDDTLTGLAGGSDPAAASPEDASPAAPAKKAAARKTTAKKATAKKTTTRKTAASVPVESPAEAAPEAALEVTEAAAPAKKAAARKTAAKKATAKKTTTKKAAVADEPAPDAPAAAQAPAVAAAAAPATGTALLFKAPEPTAAPARRTRKAAQAPAEVTPDEEAATEETPAAKAPRKAAAKRTPAKKRVEAESADEDETTAAAPAEARTGDREDESTESRDDDRDDSAEGDEGEGGGGRRRRRRGGRRRRKSGEGDSDSGESNESDADAGGADQESGRQGGNRQSGNRQGGGNRQSGNNKQGDRQGADAEADADADEGGEGTSRRRRRRRRSGDDGPEGSDDPQNTVTRVRKTRSAEDEITSISGSTRLEAKKQRRRDGREAGRRRAPIVSEAEFLARRESVERVMVIRQRDDLTQIAVIEDKVLVEHYVARESQTSIIGNVYLGRVQNVLPSMEAAFIDIGKGRNAVLYAGEVNWSALGHKDGQPRKIESVLSSGQSVLVQVTKDPIGHKGARLTSQVSLAGRFLVYVPDGTTSGISRKLPDTERNRLKTLLKEIVPDTAGVIVRTAAEGASEDELTRDVERLKARWEDIEAKVKGSAPQLLYGEPDLTLKVVRDLFTEDFGKLVIEGADAWDTVQGYVRHVAPDLEERLERFEPTGDGKDVFATYRVDEQIAKGLDRKVWLPSGGSLVIDRTEAMTVVDVNTGKFTGSGGNLEETVTKNNLEAAEEIVRQLRLRDIGGIIVVDFIDMVLESNRDLVLRRLVECLGRDRTRHQVAEVTSLGLVQMTRKRIGTGLVESFSENCEHCQGRGVVIQDTPVEPRKPEEESRRGGRRSRGGRGRQDDDTTEQKPSIPTPKDVAAVARPENAEHAADGDVEPTPVEKPADRPVEKAVEKSAERTGNRRGRAEKPAQTPVEDVVEPTRVEEPVVEPPAAPEPPKVVTRARRRSASRPTTTTAAMPVVIQAEAAAEPTPAEHAPTAEPPKVVTRTRGRSATRPAGPPSAVEAPGSAADGAPTVPGLDGEAHHDAHPVEHVPIKKKGARKR